jgi:hypothetical protein
LPVVSNRLTSPRSAARQEASVMAASSGRPTSGTFLPRNWPAVQPGARRAVPVAAQISSRSSKARMMMSS